MGNSTVSERALVFAPRGRDANVAARILAQAGLAAEVCLDLPMFIARIEEGAGLAVVTLEALRTVDMTLLSRWITDQPPWSDFPFVLLTDQGGSIERNPQMFRFTSLLGNVTFLERPFHPGTFISLVQTALRGRRRQYEARTRLQEVHLAEENLRRANETLESRVADRTRELGQTNDALRMEMDERAKVEQALRQVQKMETIGQLTGGVAHDFNNLLAAILGNLELLKKRLPAEERAQRLLAGAVEGAQRGAALTQRLLAFARRQELQTTSVDMASLIEGMKNLLTRSIGPLITLDVQTEEDLPPGKVDANQLELALLNLVVNARDAMPDGGKITVSLGKAQTKGDDLSTAGPYLRLSVTDTGTGMDAATLQKAIEPFFSTKEVGKGTGLGLSMVHGLAVQLGGALRLHSVVGQGTTAELWLPIATAAAQAISDQTKTVTPLARSGATILMVDDDSLIAMNTLDMLEDLGYTVVEARSGKTALEILRGNQSIDLLMTDYAMPGMTGAELARAALEIRPDLPIILASGYADLPDGTTLDVPRLSKPYTQQQMATQIAQLLGSIVS